MISFWLAGGLKNQSLIIPISSANSTEASAPVLHVLNWPVINASVITCNVFLPFKASGVESMCVAQRLIYESDEEFGFK